MAKQTSLFSSPPPPPSSPTITMQSYVEAFCDAPLTRKAVVDLSALLAQVIGAQLHAELPMVNVEVGPPLVRWVGASVSPRRLRRERPARVAARRRR